MRFNYSLKQGVFLRMAYVNLWVHVVWCTKRREPILSEDIRGILFKHLKEQSKIKGIKIDRINGYVDHVHLLIRMHPSQCIGNILNHLKGESSRWCNESGLTNAHPLWAAEYYAESISGRSVPYVRTYIENQVRHHQNNLNLDLQVEVRKKTKQQ